MKLVTNLTKFFQAPSPTRMVITSHNNISQISLLEEENEVGYSEHYTGVYGCVSLFQLLN